MSGDNEADTSQWLIKSVPVATREKAKANAAKLGETMGVWITRAVDNQVAMEAGNRILPPVKIEAEDHGITPYDSRITTPAFSVTELLEWLQVSAQANGGTIPTSARGHVNAMIDATFRAARGMEPRAARRQTGSNPPHQQQNDQYDDNQPETAADPIARAPGIPSSSSH